MSLIDGERILSDAMVACRGTHVSQEELIANMPELLMGVMHYILDGEEWMYRFINIWAGGWADMPPS